MSSSTERVKRLKDKLLCFKPEIDIEGARIVTKGFKESEGMPLSIQKAYAFRKQCKEKSINIEDEELIVGSYGSKPRGGVICPDSSWAVLDAELDTISNRRYDPFLLKDEDRAIFEKEIKPYWHGRSTWEQWLKQIPEESEVLQGSGAILVQRKAVRGFGEVTAGYSWVLNAGLKGITKYIEEQREKLDIAVPGDYEKDVFLKSLLISAEGIIILANRYADLAEKLAEGTQDKIRKAELNNIASICRRVPENPATTFHEALQSVYFYQNAVYMEQMAASYNPGRMDQYLLPFYQKDFDAGVINKDQAQELLDCLWIKFSEACLFADERSAEFDSGYPVFQNVSVGGVDANGNDAVNELSYMIIQATMDVQLYQPSLSVRYSLAKNPDKFLKKVVDLISLGTGFPAFHNDDAGIKMVMNKGVPLKEALEWNPCGCVETNLEGRMGGLTDMTDVNLGSVIELALTNGISRKTGTQVSKKTGNPEDFATYKDFENAVKTQLQYLIRNCVESNHILDVLCLNRPVPALSLTFKECIEKGLDYSGGGAKYTTGNGVVFIGVADLINSMSAVKQLVFEEKSLTMKELCEALADNFEGHDKAFELCKNALKYGNDEPKVNEIVGDIFTFIADDVETYDSKFGKMTAGILPVSGNTPFGKDVGALPSGRLAWKPLADGISPNGGTDFEGPTAILKSVANLPHSRFVQGTLLNMKIEPDLVATDNGKVQLMALLKTMCSLDIYHIQFNVIDKEKLILAQQHPDEYRGLLVRVAGYTAYFTELGKGVQDDIISRTTQEAI